MQNHGRLIAYQDFHASHQELMAPHDKIHIHRNNLLILDESNQTLLLCANNHLKMMIFSHIHGYGDNQLIKKFFYPPLMCFVVIVQSGYCYQGCINYETKQ